MATKLNIFYKGIAKVFEYDRVLIADDIAVIVFPSQDDNMKLLLNFMTAMCIPVDPDDIKRNAISISAEYVSTTIHDNGTYIFPVKDDNVYDAYKKLTCYVYAIKRGIKETTIRLKGIEEDIKSLADSNDDFLLIAKRHTKSLIMSQLASLESELKEQTLLLEEVSKRPPIVEKVLVKRSLEEYATTEDILQYNDILVNLQERKRIWKLEREIYDKLSNTIEKPLLHEEYILLKEVLQKYDKQLYKLLK